MYPKFYFYKVKLSNMLIGLKELWFQLLGHVFKYCAEISSFADDKCILWLNVNQCCQ